MKVLLLTGDRRVLMPGTEAHARFELQKAQVAKLEAVFWGRGALWNAFKIHGPFDVVVAQDPFWRGLVAWIVARRTHAHLSIQVHTDLSVQSLVRHILAQIVLRHADLVRVVSEKIKEQVTRMGVSAPVHVLPVFIDVSKFQNLKRGQHPKFAKVILWIGRFEAEKAPQEAIVALQKVRAAGIDAGLVMLGRGSMEGKLRSIAQAEGLSAYIEFPGWGDTAAYLGQADVVLSTSLHESWGASIIEALASGVAVVAPDVGVAREAGAEIVPREELATAVTEALRTNKNGRLQYTLLSADEWAKRWKETLL